MTRLVDVVSAPIAYDAARGQQALAPFDGLPQNLLDLIKGTAGCSPYLEGSITREADWLRDIHDQPLADVFFNILQIEGDSFQTLSDNLRIAKRRAALLIALADLGGIWDLKQVTKALTDLADTVVQKALEFLVGAEISRGKLPGCTPADIPQAAGMVALAMGKMGADELNYSSDIDLIMLFDESRFPVEDCGELRAGFIRITKRMVKLLSQNTAQGYVFRTDLRLRPDPSVTPVCISMEAAERYYESVGRTWERAAFIKARPCAGAIDAGWKFLQRLQPFIWRRHLDFAAIEDAHDMRLRIREHKGLHGPIVIAGHNMKLGCGGIREIEFFAQTRQVIVGGRDAELRSRETVQALNDLHRKGWIEAGDCKNLVEAYQQHRLIEHRIQMIDDAQTHIMPDDRAKRDRLAAFCGFDNRKDFEAEIIARLEMVHQITERFFASDSDIPEKPLDAYGFRDVGAVQAMMDKWQDYPALRSDRAQRIFSRLQPVLLAKLSAASNPNEALIHFDGFLARLPAGVQVFSLFDANPELLDLLVDICTTAPELARYLGQNARVLDFVLGQAFFQPLAGQLELQAELALLVDAATDYETVLDAARIWVHEQRFRIGVHLLRGISNADEASAAYSDVA
ncbi:MAG: glutamine-synthetase adenylyltransferase, partial [Rhodobacteraceae bacterium]|nr:glutamine-synthetase adenylyltransferase [Paracoccaceae bacterium]